MTVREAIVSILKQSSTPLGTGEIAQKIQEKQLYDFNTPHPETIVNKATRRHCLDVRTDDSFKDKYFKEGPEGKYSLLPEKEVQENGAQSSKLARPVNDARLSFRDLINTLSKSSAAAVRAAEMPEELKEVKKYLYVETDIEKSFKEKLGEANDQTIIFLCGSSGDGKSELLSKFQKTHQGQFLFHLDGTHSYHPDQTAIQALDDRFQEHKEKQKPLVVGINIGMLANYCDQGSDDHSAIRTAICRYLEKRIDEDDDNIEFVNFELYSKFKEEDGEITAPFIDALLERIANEDDANPFHRTYLESRKHNPTDKSKLEINYELLQKPEIRERLIHTLLVARLKSDLFLTARTLLDFVHSILAGESYLFDNIFAGGSSELMKSLSLFSPHQIREKEIDMFIINKTLSLDEPEFETFRKELETTLEVSPTSPDSWIRLFYIAQDLPIGNNYHQKFQSNFRHDNIEHFVEIWRLHTNYDGDINQRRNLREFYKDYLIKALQIYGNRLNPNKVGQNEFILKTISGYVFSSKADIRVDLKKIEKDAKNLDSIKPFGKFRAHLLVNADALQSLEVDANLFGLIKRINHGYKPSKHDRDSTVILEEFVELIRQAANKHSEIIIRDQRNEFTVNYNEEYDEIEVS